MLYAAARFIKTGIRCHHAALERYVIVQHMRGLMRILKQALIQIFQQPHHMSQKGFAQKTNVAFS
jgi:hypothetical protein